jgi:hypothetical protein
VEKRGAVINEKPERVVQNVFHSRPPARGPDVLERRDDFGSGERVGAVERIETERAGMVEINCPVRIGSVGDLIGEIAVRVKQRERIVPRHEGREQGGLSGSGTADDVGVCIHAWAAEPW